MYEVPSGERVYIGIFGKRNAGKSSLLNAISSQQSAIVSDTPGTTTDPVKRVMEILPLGPVVLVDTPGLDDTGALGQLRVKQTENVLHQVNIALVVLDDIRMPDATETALIAHLKQRETPYIIVYNKADERQIKEKLPEKEKSIEVSAKTGYHVHELKEMIAGMIPELKMDRPLVADLISPGDLVVLVVPIDSAAPKGRLILPQQMVLREVLDCNAMAIVVQDTELSYALKSCHRQPAVVITDSQAFEKVMHIVPENVMLTSFSILLARKKGDLSQVVAGAHALDTLKEGDNILISEGCTHHRQCDDIGTVKLPAWIQKHSGVSCEFEFTSGGSFQENLTKYALIIHCGGCMLNDKELSFRQQQAKRQGVPMTNYGTAIAHMNGILDRSLKVFRKK